jgi:hypothetical protein
MKRLTMMNGNVLALVGICIAALCIGWCSGAQAQTQPRDPDPVWHVVTDPSLPPGQFAYFGQDFHAIYPQGVILHDPIHRGFTNIVREDDGQGNEIETFMSVLEGMVEVAGVDPTPFRLTGPVETIVFGKTGNTTGTFDTEIIAMSLTGSVGGIPVEIRESPSLPSLGRTSIGDLGGGLYEIESFFDVYTELSVGGGPFMAMDPLPSGHYPQMTLCPEPGTMLLAGLGLLGLLLRMRKARR